MAYVNGKLSKPIFSSKELYFQVEESLELENQLNLNEILLKKMT